MSSTLKPGPTTPVVYPDSDGQPMAENTLQYEWIVTIKGNLDAICVGERAAFVAGDNLIYPVEGEPTIRMAPDVYIAFGRPRGHRGSYRVWEEDNIFPHVIFEILSPGNTGPEMDTKREFYHTYGVEEFYIYDPDRHVLRGWVRKGKRLPAVRQMHGHVSPRLGIRFDMAGLDLVITDPNGEPFLTFAQILERADEERERADTERKRADTERKRADTERKRANEARERADAERERADTERKRANEERERAKQATERAEKLAAKLRELGIDLDNP